MKNQIIKYIFIITIFVFSPYFAQAASIYFETTQKDIRVGDTFIINVKIDSDKVNINSVDGNIYLETDNNIVVKDFNLANSVFKMWLQKPVLSGDKKSISFVGGIPGGFNDDKVTLFNIIVEAKKEGEINLTTNNVAVYANDGKGTTVPINQQSLNIKISPKDESKSMINEWDNILISDKINPEDFIIEIGSDPSLFDGKRFATFNAIDNQSGISYYEVSENGGESIKSENIYVLQNQEDNSHVNLIVIAYDKAGNKTVSVYKNVTNQNIKNISLIIIVILVIIIIMFFSKKIKKNKI